MLISRFLLTGKLPRLHIIALYLRLCFAVHTEGNTRVFLHVKAVLWKKYSKQVHRKCRGKCQQKKCLCVVYIIVRTFTNIIAVLVRGYTSDTSDPFRSARTPSCTFSITIPYIFCSRMISFHAILSSWRRGNCQSFK